MLNKLKNALAKFVHSRKSVLKIQKYVNKNNIIKFAKFNLYTFSIVTCVTGTIGCYNFFTSKPLKIRSIKAIENNDKSLRDKFNFIGTVVEKCAPAVVYIEIQDPRRIDPETGEPTIISNGSGFIIKEDGWILTNAHVVINKPHAIITVKLNDESIYTATIEDADMNIDLALIKINTVRKLPALEFGKSGDISVGEWVIALGSPLSLSHSVTAGIISSTNRGANELGLRNQAMRYIQTDASITFGNSGGPLVNLDGNVIGINNLRITAGISFAIPIDYAKNFLEKSKLSSNREINSTEVVKTKQLGIATMTMTETIIEDLRDIHSGLMSDLINGVLVWKVVYNSPAQKGGLEAGDIITHINGTPVHQAGDIYKLMKKEENSLLKMDVIHKGKKKGVVLKINKKN